MAVRTRWDSRTPLLSRLRFALGGARFALRHLRGRTVDAAHMEWSLLSSASDLSPKPSDGLIGIALDAAHVARSVDLSELASRGEGTDASLVNLWPGEHYRLLTALARTIEADLAVEVGTFRGTGGLALAEGARRVVTFDVIPWDEIGRTWLRPADFDEQFSQLIADLSEEEAFEANRGLLASASMIFIDGPKDGSFEEAFVRRLLTLRPASPILLVFDDIRLMDMVAFWRWLPLPKLDVTSFGHVTGTGLAFLGGTDANG